MNRTHIEFSLSLPAPVGVLINRLVALTFTIAQVRVRTNQLILAGLLLLTRQGFRRNLVSLKRSGVYEVVVVVLLACFFSFPVANVRAQEFVDPLPKVELPEELISELRASIQKEESLLVFNVLPEKEEWRRRTYLKVIKKRLEEENLTEEEAEEVISSSIGIVIEILNLILGRRAEMYALEEEESMMNTNDLTATDGTLVEENGTIEIELFEGTEEREEGSFLYISGTSPPVMPDVRVKVSGNTQNYEVKLVVEDITYKRVNSNSPWILRREDETSFPVSGGWEEIENEETWDVDFGTSFRGGKAYAIARAGEVEDTLIFHIRGTNPDGGLIRAYQATIPNGGAWYFPRMLRQESTFRQFNNGNPGPDNGAPVEEGERSIDNGGRPNWGDPYGWGLKQLDNLGGPDYGYLTTFNGRYGPSPDEVWNWQANQRKGVEFFNGDKLQAAQNAWDDAIDLIEGWEESREDLVQDNYPMQIVESLNAAEVGTIIEDEMVIGTISYSSHHRNLQANNVGLLIADALKRYNGGRYYTIQIPIEDNGRNPGAELGLPRWLIDKTQLRGNQQADYVQEISTTTGW